MPELEVPGDLVLAKATGPAQEGGGDQTEQHGEQVCLGVWRQPPVQQAPQTKPQGGAPVESNQGYGQVEALDEGLLLGGGKELAEEDMEGQVKDGEGEAEEETVPASLAGGEEKVGRLQ